ncbi:AAA family ATPase [Phytohabitans kaempferiae]|uniref:AAA family ATPase n=1 Tax=Phytohabitans kaempferiae TaxID=1620943 RepID=A0ABV6M9D5_9ACTN
MSGPSRPAGGSGKASPRPLRFPVLHVLADDPSRALSVTAVTKALPGRSSGAVGAALTRLVEDGAATVTLIGKARHYQITPVGIAEFSAGPPATRTRRTPEPTPAEALATAPAAGPVPPRPGAVLRPNGQWYLPRQLGDSTDVQVLRRLRRDKIPALLYGPPGTGKTSLIEAAFADVITVAGHGDTAVEDLVGSYVPLPDGGFEFSYGPLVVAMREGRALFVDDATLISPKVLAVLYPAMDGRGQVTITAHHHEEVTATDGFYVVAGHNPNVHGAVLTEALASRFSVHIEVTTDFDLAVSLGVPRAAVAAAVARSTTSSAAGRSTGRHSYANCWRSNRSPPPSGRPRPWPTSPPSPPTPAAPPRSRHYVRRSAAPSPRSPSANRNETHHGQTPRRTARPNPPAPPRAADRRARPRLLRPPEDGRPMSTISGHVTSATTSTPVVAAASPWKVWSTAWTRHAIRVTGRTDATVVVEPGAAGTSPARCIPATAAIEVDADIIGDPTIADPRRAAHKDAVPAAYGALLHECAHVAHSLWHTPPGTPPVVAAVADMLEESRAEGRYRARRPRDRRWLRRAVTTLVAPTDTPTDSPWSAAYAAGLLLARVDARILAARDVHGLRPAVTKILGRKVFTGLRQIWREAHQVDDTDADTMIDLARRWCRLLGIDPDTDRHVPTDTATTRIIAAILRAVLDRITASDKPPGPPGHGSLVGASPPITWTYRDPTTAEREAADRLTALLRRARTRDPISRPHAAATPPGRLRTRAAVTLAAQRATGAPPTAQPWQRTTRQQVPDPDLAIAITVDVSGSMASFARPLSAAAWILAHAGARSHARTATLAFGDKVVVLIPPGRRPTQVCDMTADAGTERFVEALTEADRLLHLSTPGAARLLVVVSDGHFPKPDAAQAAISRLHHAGCPVLWLAPAGGYARRYTDTTTTIDVDDPTTCINLIGKAAIDALANA